LLQLDRLELGGRINRLIYSRKVLLLLAVCGSLITTAVAVWIYRIESRALSQQFYEQVEDRALFLARELDAGVEALYTIGEVIRFVDSLPALVFDDVAGATLARNPGLLAFEWLPRVRADQLVEFEAKQQRYYAGYQVQHFIGDGEKISPAPRDLPEYFPVTYVTPLHGNESALGADFLSERNRRKALVQAWHSGEFSLSSPLKLLQIESGARGALLVLPVYFGRPDNQEERRQALKGFVVAAVDVRRVVSRIVAKNSVNASDYMRIEDVTTSTDPLPLFVRGTSASHLEQSVELATFGGRTLRVTMAPDAVQYRLNSLYFPVVVAFAGGLMVLLVCGYLYLLQRRGMVIGEHVLRQTRALREANFRLETLSVTDPLTGLSNRRAFDDYLEQEWQRAARDKTSLSILLVDVDHFKKINDQYGHPAGDACLRELAQRLRGHFKRPADRVVRFGGEEFAVVMPGTDPRALSQADRFREVMEKTPIKLTEDESIVVTISAGLATVIPDGGLTPRDLIKFADEAMYQAKRGGRNRIECYGGYQER
jgi:diguanylate cyclase (GGDEF)-like protein